MNCICDEELYHFGILGMHWGEKNGPPYPLGREQHTPEQNVLNAMKKKPNYSVKFRKPSEMSTAELMDAIKRMETEKKYTSMYNELHPKKQGVIKKLVNSAKRSGPGFISSNILDPLGKEFSKQFVDAITGEAARRDLKERETAEAQKRKAAEERLLRDRDYELRRDAMDAFNASLAKLADAGLNVKFDEAPRKNERTELGYQILDNIHY